MSTISDVYLNTKSLLKQGNIESYVFEAKCILEHILDVDKDIIAIKPDETVSSEQICAISDMVYKRISGVPLQYLIGKWEFYGYEFKVGKGVLIPRADTETLVSLVIDELNGKENPVIADLCSGSGCIAITLKKEIAQSKVYAIEFSKDAINYLTENIKINNCDVNLVYGDVCDKNTVESVHEKLDCLVSNPPYLTEVDMKNLQKEVTFEPSMALEGGSDGLYFYRKISSIWKDKIKDGGLIAFEIGISQEKDVEKILADEGYKDICVKQDFNGIIRVVYARR